MTTKTLKFSLLTLALCAFSLTNAQDKKKPTPEKMFASFDTNDDKSISLEEFKSKKRKNEVKPAALEKRFAKIDANSDGSITLDEFKASLTEAKEKKEQ